MPQPAGPCAERPRRRGKPEGRASLTARIWSSIAVIVELPVMPVRNCTSEHCRAPVCPAGPPQRLEPMKEGAPDLYRVTIRCARAELLAHGAGRGCSGRGRAGAAGGAGSGGRASGARTCHAAKCACVTQKNLAARTCKLLATLLRNSTRCMHVCRARRHAGVRAVLCDWVLNCVQHARSCATVMNHRIPVRNRVWRHMLSIVTL